MTKIETLTTQLQAITSKWNTVDPTSPAYKALVAFLDAQPLVSLVALEKANIKFISALARNRVAVAAIRAA